MVIIMTNGASSCARFSYMDVASLTLLASHRMATQCLVIIEVIKLSGQVHGVETQDSHAKMNANGQCVQPLFLPAIYMYAFVGVMSMVYAFHVLAVVELWSVEVLHGCSTAESRGCNVSSRDCMNCNVCI